MSREGPRPRARCPSPFLGRREDKGTAPPLQQKTRPFAKIGSIKENPPRKSEKTRPNVHAAFPVPVTLFIQRRAAWTDPDHIQPRIRRTSEVLYSQTDISDFIHAFLSLRLNGALERSPEPRSRVVMARLPVDEVFDEEHKNIAVQIIASLVDPERIKRALKRKSFRLRAINIFFMHPERHSLHYREYAGWYAVFSTMNDAFTSNNWAMFFKGSVVQDICFKFDNTRELSKFSYYATRLLHPGCRAEDVNFLINYMENWLPIKKDLLDSLQEQDPSLFVPVLKEKAYDIFSCNHMYMSCFKTASAALGATIHCSQSPPPCTQSKPSSAVAIPANVAPPPPPPPDSESANQGGRGLKRRASKPPPFTDQSQLPPLKVRSRVEMTENNIVLPQMTLPQSYPSDDNGQHQPVPNQSSFAPFTPLFVPGTPGLHFYPPLGGREAAEESELFPEDPSDLATPPSRDSMNIEVCEQYLRSPNTDHTALSAISAAVISELQNTDRTPFGTTLAHMPHVQCIQGAVFLFNAFIATLSSKAGFPLAQHTAMMTSPSSLIPATDLSKLELLGYDGPFCTELKVLADSIETKPFSEWPLLFPEHLHFIVSLHVVSPCLSPLSPLFSWHDIFMTVQVSNQTSPHTRGTAFQDIGHLVAKVSMSSSNNLAAFTTNPSSLFFRKLYSGLRGSTA